MGRYAAAVDACRYAMIFRKAADAPRAHPAAPVVGGRAAKKGRGRFQRLSPALDLQIIPQGVADGRRQFYVFLPLIPAFA